jgi:hypothetical protein
LHRLFLFVESCYALHQSEVAWVEKSRLPQSLMALQECRLKQT